MATSARVLIDHDEIRRWAEARGARPARVKGTGGKGDPGILRLDFPGFSGEESLEPLSWDQWLKAFDENNLALIVQDRTASGQPSRFNKLVSRESVLGEAPPRRRTAAPARRRKTARKSIGRKAPAPKRRTRSRANR
jgi:hypothetical protein